MAVVVVNVDIATDCSNAGHSMEGGPFYGMRAILIQMEGLDTNPLLN